MHENSIMLPVLNETVFHHQKFLKQIYLIFFNITDLQEENGDFIVIPASSAAAATLGCISKK